MRWNKTAKITGPPLSLLFPPLSLSQSLSLPFETLKLAFDCFQLPFFSYFFFFFFVLLLYIYIEREKERERERKNERVKKKKRAGELFQTICTWSSFFPHSLHLHTHTHGAILFVCIYVHILVLYLTKAAFFLPSLHPSWSIFHYITFFFFFSRRSIGWLLSPSLSSPDLGFLVVSSYC